MRLRCVLLSAVVVAKSCAVMGGGCVGMGGRLQTDGRHQKVVGESGKLAEELYPQLLVRAAPPPLAPAHRPRPCSRT